MKGLLYVLGGGLITTERAGQIPFIISALLKHLYYFRCLQMLSQEVIFKMFCLHI